MTHIPKSYTVPSWPLSQPTPPPSPENSTDLHESQEWPGQKLGWTVHPCGDAPASSPSPLLRSRPPEVQLGGLGERCELPQRGLGRSPSRIRFWCILVLKSYIWWQQF